MATTDATPPESDVPADTAPPIPTGELIELFGNERRRHALVVLRRECRAMAISELAEWVVTREEGTAPQDVSKEQRDLVVQSLQRVHLPRLDAVGLVEFEPEQGIVGPADATTA